MAITQAVRHRRRQRKRQTAGNADADAAASNEHVRRLQSQLQSTAEQLVALGRTDIVRAVVEQVVGASGSHAVEPGQPGQSGRAAATAQPGVPRYVVPPATGDLAFRRSHWDGKPAEIHAMILKHAGPLTLFLCGLLGDAATLDEATKLQLWTDAFKVDWQGDLRLLPRVELTADNGLLLVHSRSMYRRLCKRFPHYTVVSNEGLDAAYNNYVSWLNDAQFYTSHVLLIPMRHGWFDLVDFSYPITLARLAFRYGFLDLLKHLDRKYKTLQRWMTVYDAAEEYWHEAVDRAAQYGHLDVMQYLFEAGVAGCSTDAMDLAAGNGHLHVVKWLHENRTEGCTYRAMNWAAKNGNLHVVKWLHENRTEGCTTGAMDDAAAYGQLHVVKWLHANKREGCTEQAMIDAARRGHLHVVQWLHETRDEACTPAALDAAISRGHMDVVKYMHSKGSRASSDPIEREVLADKPEMLRYLIDCGYAVELRALDYARTSDIIDILFGSLTLDQAQTLLAEANQGYSTKDTIDRLRATIRRLRKPRKPRKR